MRPVSASITITLGPFGEHYGHRMANCIRGESVANTALLVIIIIWLWWVWIIEKIDMWRTGNRFWWACFGYTAFALLCFHNDSTIWRLCLWHLTGPEHCFLFAWWDLVVLSVYVLRASLTSGSVMAWPDTTLLTDFLVTDLALDFTFFSVARRLWKTSAELEESAHTVTLTSITSSSGSSHSDSGMNTSDGFRSSGGIQDLLSGNIPVLENALWRFSGVIAFV